MNRSVAAASATSSEAGSNCRAHCRKQRGQVVMFTVRQTDDGKRHVLRNRNGEVVHDVNMGGCGQSSEQPFDEAVDDAVADRQSGSVRPITVRRLLCLWPSRNTKLESLCLSLPLSSGTTRGCDKAAWQSRYPSDRPDVLLISPGWRVFGIELTPSRSASFPQQRCRSLVPDIER